MPDSVYKVIELVGTSSKSWEEAAKTAVERLQRSKATLRRHLHEPPRQKRRYQKMLPLF